jgi:dienelactone hydrolase
MRARLQVHRLRRAATGLLAAASLFVGSSFASEVPQTVYSTSRDGRTTLAGYLFVPQSAPPWPAVVMLHGRAGPYSTAAKGRADATTLSARHREWGRYWAARGYLALHVDSFGPRGHAGGFPAGSYANRPAEVNEQSVRPLDAYGAAAYLRGRGDVIPDRIGLQGWSNGAMAGLATLASQPPGADAPTPASGFRAALLLYPGCNAQAAQEYRPYAPALLFVAANDEEVAPQPCRNLAERVQQRGVTHLELVWYEGATHSFDDPGPRRQSVEANRRAKHDAMARAERFFAQHLRGD